MINGHRCHAQVAHLSWLYFLLSWLTGISGSFFLTWRWTMNRWAAFGAKLLKSEKKKKKWVTYLLFWFWNLERSYQVVLNYLLSVLLILAHITIVEEFFVPIHISHAQPRSYYHGSKALCFILKEGISPARKNCCWILL